MRVQKILRIATFVMFIAIALPFSANAIVPEASTANTPAKTENPRAQQLLQRLEEIKGMDKSEMTRLGKKSLRKETREIKKEMKAISGGVYLSVGAVIIIILLLILLL
jgi:Skp family chaperone for outer membrane proteins